MRSRLSYLIIFNDVVDRASSCSLTEAANIFLGCGSQRTWSLNSLTHECVFSDRCTYSESDSEGVESSKPPHV